MSKSKGMETSLQWEHEPMSKIPFTVFRGHEESINCLRFVRGAKEILSASEDTGKRIQ